MTDDRLTIEFAKAGMAFTEKAVADAQRFIGRYEETGKSCMRGAAVRRMEQALRRAQETLIILEED